MTALVLPRRKFLSGGLALLAAPAIVRASSLMQIKPERDGVTFIPAPYSNETLELMANPPMACRYFCNQVVGIVLESGHITWLNPDTYEILIPERQPGA